MLYNKTCPLITNKLSKKRFLNKPWIWNTIRKCIFKKNKLYKRYITNKTVLNKLSYTSYTNIVTTILRYVENKYYNDTFKTHSNNPKQMWKAIKQLIGYTKKSKDTTFISDKPNSEIANKFNDHFINVGPHLAKEFCDNSLQSIYKTLTNKNKNSLFLFPTSVNEIKKIIENCDNKYSIDTLGFNMHIIKQIKDEISPILAILFNKCLQVGLFPDDLKNI